MTDHPEEFLNLEPETAADASRPGGWWLASILSLVVFAAIGGASLYAIPRNESDWFGARYLVAVGLSLTAGAVASVVCAGVSLQHRERYALWSMLLALPSLAMLILVAAYTIPLPPLAAPPPGESLGSVMDFVNKLEKDPDLGLRERWYDSRWNDSSSDLKKRAFLASTENGLTPYTSAQLERIYEVAPENRKMLFQHPGCSPEFLRMHFDEAWQLSVSGQHDMLDNMVWNPNLPLPLLEKAAQSSEIHLRSREAAKNALAKRMKSTAPTGQAVTAPATKHGAPHTPP